MIIVVDAEVDARTALQGSKESRGHVGTDPVGHSIQFVTRHEPTGVDVIVAAAVNVVHFGWFLIKLCVCREMKIVRTIVQRECYQFVLFPLFDFSSSIQFQSLRFLSNFMPQFPCIY
ncbi:unnamed protein product [Sphenostylis stenocarpa]|uniref:Uncharacterized protein n=1 Tax=Sphenostylis stenocarpa TaxID=92480 RepID=A0AA86SEP7_9FABA|nr:unnamed protein product [Sphenostylis stenocarpa]